MKGTETSSGKIKLTGAQVLARLLKSVGVENNYCIAVGVLDPCLGPIGLAAPRAVELRSDARAVVTQLRSTLDDKKVDAEPTAWVAELGVAFGVLGTGRRAGLSRQRHPTPLPGLLPANRSRQRRKAGWCQTG